MDPGMEAVDIRHIQDKFPEKNGGLKDLYDKGPQDRFFLVKFWVCCVGVCVCVSGVGGYIFAE